MRSDAPHVLAVAHDALDNQDALHLWSVFSKCRNSLQDGPRLENITWRLASRDLAQNRQLLHRPWPPTPESDCSNASGSSGNIAGSSAASSPFFSIAPRKTITMPARPVGRIICDIIPPGPTQKLTRFQKNEPYPTPSSSDSSGSASSSAVSIAIESPTIQQPPSEVPKLILLAPTPNLTPHPTPPASPLFAPSAPPAPRSPPRRDPPGPLFLSHAATRGMGSPIFAPADSTNAPALQASYAPQSTHILPIGGRDVNVPAPGQLGASAATKGKFYLAAQSSHSSSRSSETSNSYENGDRSSSSGSDSSRERGQGQSTTFVHGPERGLGNGRGRGRGQTRNPGRGSSSSEEVHQQPQQEKSPPEPKQRVEPPPRPAPSANTSNDPSIAVLKQRSVSALALEMTAPTEKGHTTTVADDARSVSSLATSSSQRVRARGKQPVRTALPRQHSRSRSRKGGTHAQLGMTSNLPPASNIAAAAAMVERTMSSKRLVQLQLQTSDEEDEWSDESADGAESIEGEVDEGEQDGEEEWEDDVSESVEQSGAPPPSLQQQPPPQLAHSRRTASTDLRQLPTRPHRSAGHLPALARDIFAKAPRTSYENLTQLASSRPGGLTLLLGGPRMPQPGVADQYRQQQQQLHQQNGVGGVPALRPLHGGFGGLGLHMSSARPTPLSPIPPTPATAAREQHHEPAKPQPPPQARAPSSPRQPQQPQLGPPPRRPGIQRALSSSALPPHFGGAPTGTSGSLGKSSVAEPVVSVGGPDVLEGSIAPTAAGSLSAGRNGGYRPKGPPAEMEYDDDDDEESDADGRGEPKGRDDGQLSQSQSAAQEKLRVFLSKNRSTNGVDAAEAERRRLFNEAGDVPWATADNQHNVAPPYVPPPPNRTMTTAPVGFPYNLPAPAPPSTPRTTRQQMLRNEMSESVRHNLLWQRKLSRTDTIGPQPRRTKSTVNVLSEAAYAAAGQTGRQPAKSLVRVTPRAPGTERRDTLPPMDPPVPEVGPKKKLVRNLSWANTSDYHARGW
ncbi:hypothetical protein K438DRAFT_1953229 [Mycena galopus ATCC 62051]|nr:hypothetical protein K438DRAFT_1953229 [Mycena galopus ATCC 62051]